MGKVKLAICVDDPGYQERFVKCLMNHYKEQYEIHAFTNFGELEDAVSQQNCVIIAGGSCTKEQVLEWATTERAVIYLQENDSCLSGEIFLHEPENIVKQVIFLDKFQEVYRIMEHLESKTGVKNHIVKAGQRKEVKCVGVYSLDVPVAQLPYAAMLASIYGEKERVLLLNLLPHSGMGIPEEEALCIEDILSAVSVGNCSQSRILGGIGHKAKWDYIYPAKNTETLSEASKENYDKLIEILVKELGYETVIINFGANFSGVYDFMDSCNEFYLLSGKDGQQLWRERDFTDEMERREKHDFLNRIFWIKTPTALGSYDDWEKLEQQWTWGVLGDEARKRAWSENIRG